MQPVCRTAPVQHLRSAKSSIFPVWSDPPQPAPTLIDKVARDVTNSSSLVKLLACIGRGVLLLFLLLLLLSLLLLLLLL